MVYRKKKIALKKRKIYKLKKNVVRNARVTTSRVRKIVNSMAESKYFDTKTIQDTTNNGAGMSMYRSDQNAAVFVRAFSLNEAWDDAGNPLRYGINAAGNERDIYSFNMTSNSNTGPQVREGCYVSPSFTQTEWSLIRQQVSLVSGGTAAAAAQAPYRVRILRLVPRTKMGMNQLNNTPDPRLDAFMTQEGEPTGIDSRNLSGFQIQLLKANTRKYYVKMDKQFDMACPLAYSSANDTDATNMRCFSGLGGSYHREMVCKHDIGKKLYYRTEADLIPTAGGKNEFILIHVWLPSTLDDILILPENLKIGCKAVSTFKDF